MRFEKGFKNDAGLDIVLDEDIFLPTYSMTVVEIPINFTPRKNEMAVITPRSSYAAKGIIICNCPIDCDYKGKIHIVAYNGSNSAIKVPAGHSFCQLIVIKIRTIKKGIKIKRSGRRKDDSFGSTGG